ncbi:efflux RND transporter periplasmic adaptor subunit [Metallumcola ferriviriculae]|uniref:Efflux RND transporter periplasmic adaptor subunit n=1 Tax=Metallumcola ferriviriculae TaxID=3039180 RepID=A0AAU0UL35_9FIRM|nr:efflux RND transporter periplasmic adaptor subunit [Desulfitibacteraceae bacterium MK1]
MLLSKTVRMITYLTLVATLLFVLSGCGAQPVEAQKEQVETIAVSVVKAEKGDLQKFSELSGKVEGQSEVNVIPKMGGKVEEVKVKVGDRVQKGDVMVRLESDEIRARLNQAQAGLAAARASFTNAESNYQRMQELFKQGAISQQQLDSVEMQYETAKSQGVKQAEALVEQARIALDSATIEAPIDGIVAFRYVDPGQTAGPTSPVVTVVNMDTVVVRVNVPETDINTVKMGDTVKVTVPAAAADEAFTGELTMVAPAADARTKAYPIEVAIDNKEHVLKPGMFAQVALGTRSVEDALIIPQEALVDINGIKVVYVAVDGKAVQQDVSLAFTTGEQAAVLTGINAGDAVIIQGQHRVDDGSPVTVQGGDK